MSITERPTELVLSDVLHKLIKTDLNRADYLGSRLDKKDTKRWPNSRLTKNFIVSRLTILFTDENLKSRALVIQRMLEPLIRKARSTGEISNDLKVSIRHCGNDGFEEIGDERYIWVSSGVDELDNVDVLLKLVFVDEEDDIKQHPGYLVIVVKDPDITYYYQN